MSKAGFSHVWIGRVTAGARASVLAMSMVAAEVVIPASEPEAAAQPATAQLGDDLSVVFANSADIAEGKGLAESACVSCHGANGVSTAPGVPHLAGQRSPYLHLVLKAYQSGARPGSTMKSAVAFLNNDALIKLAAYYASLDPAPRATGNVTVSDPVEDGQAAAAACAGCHGDTGISKTAGFPNLIGLDPQYLVAAMKAYKSGQRKNDLMQSMVASVNESVMDKIALFYGLQKPGRAQTPAPGDRSGGQAAATPCAGCHGDDGVSGTSATPSLAGQDAAYLVAALAAYKQGARRDETMKGMVAPLDNATIKNLAAYYAAQEPRPPTVRKPLVAQEWAQRCDRCHGVNGNSTDPRFPALAGQRSDYIEQAVHDYQKGVRKSAEMSAMSQVLSEDDVKNLASYYSRQTPRAVILIAVPSR